MELLGDFSLTVPKNDLVWEDLWKNSLHGNKGDIFFVKTDNLYDPPCKLMFDRLVRLTQANFKLQENQQNVDTILPFIDVFFIIVYWGSLI